MIMMDFWISKKKKQRFQDLFHDIHEITIPSWTNIQMKALRMRDKDFIYQELVAELSNIITHFCLSRLTIDTYNEAEREWELRDEATRKLVDYKINDWEAWELLLYCFLETYLQAPKILSKIELKTSSQDYVKGSDWVHLLDLWNWTYHLIFCESKLNNDLTTSLREAFTSIKTFKTREKNNLHNEITLVDNMLSREEYNAEKYAIIKDIIFPKKNSGFFRDNAFAIFAWFELDFTENEKSLPSREFEEKLHEKLRLISIEKEEYIKSKIIENWLEWHHFYIYLFPFTRLANVRKKIIENLTLNKNEFI